MTINESVDNDNDEASMEGSYLMLTLTGLMKTLDTSNLDLQISKNEVSLSISSAHITLSATTSRSTSSSNSSDAPSSSSATTTAMMRSFSLCYHGKNYQFNAYKTVASFKKKKGLLQIKVYYQTCR